ncbi:MAG: hypothetical protein WC806_06655, partial [Candidatus Gracilibacteria bacterium]
MFSKRSLFVLILLFVLIQNAIFPSITFAQDPTDCSGKITGQSKGPFETFPDKGNTKFDCHDDPGIVVPRGGDPLNLTKCKFDIVPNMAGQIGKAPSKEFAACVGNAKGITTESPNGIVDHETL